MQTLLSDWRKILVEELTQDYENVKLFSADLLAHLCCLLPCLVVCLFVACSPLLLVVALVDVFTLTRSNWAIFDDAISIPWEPPFQ